MTIHSNYNKVNNARLTIRLYIKIYFVHRRGEDTIFTIANADMGVEINTQFPKFEIMCKKLSEELSAKQQVNFDEYKTTSPEQR